MKYTLSLFIILCFFTQFYGQETQKKIYMNIPGSKDKIDTEDIIQKLLLIKKLPMQKKESEIQDYKLENDLIKDFSKYLRDLDEKSRGLYDFKSPFREMVGNSSDASVLDVIAGRKAKKEDYKIFVMQTAKPDSFMSASTPKNKALPPCSFTISIGGTVYKFKFSGGTIIQLADSLQQQAQDALDIRLVNDTASTAVLVISGKQTGEKNKLKFDGDVKALMDINLLGFSDAKTDDRKIDFSRIVAKSANPINATARSVELKPGDEGEVGLSDENIKVEDNSILYFNARIDPFNPEAALSNVDLTNLDISLMEPVKVSNVTVAGGSLITFYEEKKELPPLVSNFTEILTLNFTDGTVKTYFIDASGMFSNALTTYKGKTVEKAVVRNKNTDREFIISDARIVTKISEGGLQPKNTISKACDAIISFDGVEVRRDKNTIEDLVDGVTLNLKNESKDPVMVNIDHDYKKVEDAVLAWVDSYNKAMEFLFIITKPNQDRTPLSQRTPETMKDGVFQTETTLLILRNKLRSITSEPYKTVYEKALSLLEQIGLYTKKTGSFSLSSDEWTSAKMGLLNVELDKFHTVLKTKFDGVEQLFANDTDGDLVKDSGVAVAANQSLKLGIGAGSFIDRRIAFNDARIKDDQRDIDKMNSDLASYELEQRKKYGRMNQVLSETENKQKWLNNQVKSQQ